MSVERAIAIDPACGFPDTIQCGVLNQLVAICCIAPCANAWAKQFPTGCASFEDQIVRMIYVKPASATEPGGKTVVDYNPDLRAPEIRKIIEDRLSKVPHL